MFGVEPEGEVINETACSTSSSAGRGGPTTVVEETVFEEETQTSASTKKNLGTIVAEGVGHFASPVLDSIISLKGHVELHLPQSTSTSASTSATETLGCEPQGDEPKKRNSFFASLESYTSSSAPVPSSSTTVEEKADVVT
ncbi:unnamed protein product, partial [Amoebophrya sp. A25]|eukprot:GSA25T00001401001.1